ncbi:hypothetical protein BHE74_00028493 [Ensete ventricosum]|nr:hypothetical protein BHE74_00028493 [Ensete ventricosum]
MGRVSYEFDYKIALTHFQIKHLGLEVEEDPCATLPEDDNVSMEMEVPFDDSDPWHSGELAFLSLLDGKSRLKTKHWKPIVSCRTVVATPYSHFAPDLPNSSSSGKLYGAVVGGDNCS